MPSTKDLILWPITVLTSTDREEEGRYRRSASVTKSWVLLKWCDELNVSPQIYTLKYYPQCIFPPSSTLWKRLHLYMLRNAMQITLSICHLFILVKVLFAWTRRWLLS